jgi:hypothetical protein
MRKTTLFFCLTLLVVLAAFSQSAEENKVWSRVEALTKAVFETKDSVALKGLVSSQVSYGHSGGNIEDKAMMVTAAATSATTYRKPELEKVSIDISGKTAIVRHNFRAGSVDAKGVETALNLAVIQVWKKERGDWKLWARQAVKILPKS